MFMLVIINTCDANSKRKRRTFSLGHFYTREI